MIKIITFGEILLRLSTTGHLRFSQATEFATTYAGGEFNVAVSLANYGMDTEFVSRLPTNEIGACALAEMKKYSVGTDHIQFGGDRLGIYFLETGAGPRGSKVVYDRTNSAFASIRPGTIDWRSIFSGANWFHWSGITPGVSESAAEACLEAVGIAHEMGLVISTDLNYRSQLWKYGKEPSAVMPKLLSCSQIILGDLDTAFLMLGMETVRPDYGKMEPLSLEYDKLFSNLPNLKTMATTLRYSVNASHQRIGGILYDGNKMLATEIMDVMPVVDRVGSGDAFMGGLIYGLLRHGNDKQRALDIALAACCLKHTIHGDHNLATMEEVQKLAAGNVSGLVTR
ncbi:MAG: sugar kinase [Sediminicola sp.]